MTRQIAAFVGFWYDFVVGDDWRVAAGIVAALALTYAVSRTTGLPAWWILPAAVLILLPLSLCRLAHHTRPEPPGR